MPSFIENADDISAKIVGVNDRLDTLDGGPSTAFFPNSYPDV